MNNICMVILVMHDLCLKSYVNKSNARLQCGVSFVYIFLRLPTKLTPKSPRAIPKIN